jgi:hypothetical protein
MCFITIGWVLVGAGLWASRQRPTDPYPRSTQSRARAIKRRFNGGQRALPFAGAGGIEEIAIGLPKTGACHWRKTCRIGLPGAKGRGRVHLINQHLTGRGLSRLCQSPNRAPPIVHQIGVAKCLQIRRPPRENCLRPGSAAFRGGADQNITTIGHPCRPARRSGDAAVIGPGSAGEGRGGGAWRRFPFGFGETERPPAPSQSPAPC